MTDEPKKRNGEWSEVTSEVIHIAESLIHDHFPFLKQARILFLFRKEAQKTEGKNVIGHCEKVSEKLQVHLEYDFLIWLSEEDYADFSMAQREALIDHELMHCSIGENGWTTRPHDFEGFSDEIARHGLWSADLREADTAINQWRQVVLPGAEVTLTYRGKVVTTTGEMLGRLANELGD